MKTGKMEAPTNEQKRAIILFGIIVLVIVGFLIYAYSKPKTIFDESNNQAQTSTNEEVKEDTSVLGLTVRSTIYGIAITNNEVKEMKKCKVSLNQTFTNSGWETRYTFAPGVEQVITWQQFAKNDGEVFNPDTHKVQRVLVNTCEGQTGRYAEFKS